MEEIIIKKILIIVIVITIVIYGGVKIKTHNNITVEDIENEEVFIIDSTTEVIEPNEDVLNDATNKENNDDSEIIKEIVVKEEGMTKEEIIWLQENLKYAGFNIKVDGSFGPRTKEILFQFKSSQDTLENNKVYDEKTEELLYNIREKNAVVNDNSTPENKGNEITKDDIKWLQESLKIAGFYTALDGDFGNNTKNKLYEFKSSINSLKNNKVYDDKTKEKLSEIRKSKEIKNIGSEMLVVNKNNFLPYDYVPKDLRVVDVSQGGKMTLPSNVATQVEKLFKDAKDDGYNLFLSSAYRSYDYQETIFSRRVRNYGFDSAEKIIAIPGQSEHQTGLAFDVSCASMSYGLDSTFDETDEFKWLMDNAYKYGFILRYRKNKEDITGYVYEPWHYRYIGNTEIAKEIMDDELVLEEYFEQE